MPKREVIQVYADQAPGSHGAACHGETGSDGHRAPQSRVGSEDGDRPRASGPALCAHPPVLLWVWVGLTGTINSELAVFTKSAGAEGFSSFCWAGPARGHPMCRRRKAILREHTGSRLPLNGGIVGMEGPSAEGGALHLVGLQAENSWEGK